MISEIVVFLLVVPSALAQCSCAQGSKGLDLVLLVDTDSASLANTIGGRNPLDYAKNFLTRLLFNYNMDISSNDQTGVRVAVFGVNATGAFATKATLLLPGVDNNTPDSVRNAINNLTPDGSTLPTVDIDSGILQAQNLFNKPNLGQRQNIPNVVITISSSTPSSAAEKDARVLQTQYGALMIGIAVSLSDSQLDYSTISSPNAALKVTSLSPNGFDALINPILGLLCTAEGFCGGTGGSTAFPTNQPTPSSGLPNQPKQCDTGGDAYPRLWLDVVLLIDSSAAQTSDNFINMINDIQAIWGQSGGPIVSQATARTRVGIVTFDTSANIVAPLDKINSNQELTDVLNGLKQNTSQTVDASNALLTASTLFGDNVRGDRPNVPNVIIIYTADWAGPDACHTGITLKESTVVLAVRYKNRFAVPPAIPPCIYTPGEMYDSSNPNRDALLVESLAFGSSVQTYKWTLRASGCSSSKRQKANRAANEVWIQFWLPNKTDNNYYLRDKFAECVIQATDASTNYVTAQTGCHKIGSYLPNEFSSDKHQFLLRVAQAGRILTQWNGLQYDPNLRQWYWDNYDQTSNRPLRTPALSGDYTNWNCNNQPDTSSTQYCVREGPGTGGCNGFRWSTTLCQSFQALYHNQYLCQQDACDASNYCSNY